MTTLRNAFSLMMSSRSTIWSCSWSSRIDTRLHWWEYEVTNLGQNRGNSICSNCLTCMSLRMAPRNLRVYFHIDMQLVMAFCHGNLPSHANAHTLLPVCRATLHQIVDIFMMTIGIIKKHTVKNLSKPTCSTRCHATPITALIHPCPGILCHVHSLE